MKKIITILCAAAIMLSSCDQENIGTIYEPDAPYVAFSSPVVSGNILSAENDFSVNVQVVRSHTNTPATARLILEMNEAIEGVFDLENTEVTFEEGMGTASVKIIPQVEPALIDPTRNYVFNLSLTGENASSFYNKTSYRASFRYTPIGAGKFISEFFEDEWPVEIEMLNVGDLTLYRIKDLYEPNFDITLKTEGGNVTIEPQAAWFYEEYGNIFISGEGTVDGKVITMMLNHYVPDLGSYGEYLEVLTLP